MSSGIYIAAAGAVAQSDALDAVSHNIANASTAGYQSERVSFKEALGKARSPDVTLVQASTAHAVDGTNGALMQTDNPLDVALEGDGVFSVKTPLPSFAVRAAVRSRSTSSAVASLSYTSSRGTD